MKQTRLIVRVAAAVLALLLFVTTLVSGLGATGFAAESPYPVNVGGHIITVRDNNNLGIDAVAIEPEETYFIMFEFEHKLALEEPTNAADEREDFKRMINRSNVGNSDSNWRAFSSRSDIDYVDNSGNDFVIGGYIEARYLESTESTEMIVTLTTDDGAILFNVSLDIGGFIDEEIETPNDPTNPTNPGTPGVGDPGTAEEEDPPPTSQIVVENMIALDSAGNKIDEITEDTPAFTLEVVFADIGLQYMPARYLRERDLDAYVTNAGGFILGSSARGTMSLVTQSDYPRFRARFTDITYSGTGNTLGFTVFYDLDGYDWIDPIKGEGTGTLFSAKGEGEDEEDGTGAGIKVPKIIISAYSYGEEAIFAGDEFPLDFTVTNTSADLALENIVITMTPAAPEGADKGPGLIVASSSNSIYLDSLGPGASEAFNVSFKARPDAEVTSHLVNVRFSYEYQKSEKEGYVAAPELSESIAIPVSQIDRFTVDPLQYDPSDEVGREAYMTVSFINKGKSPTYNISGTVTIDESVSAPPQHFGNLDAGASDSLDFYLTGSMPGMFEGKVVIQYEDDNGTVNEVETPFTFTVMEPYVPDFGMGGGMDPGMLEPPPPAGPGVWTIVLCAVGGLAIAVPLALVLMKRVKAKGREEFDETV